MNKDTIVVSAFRVHRSEFSCSLAAALLDGLFKHPAKYWEQPTPLSTKKKGPLSGGGGSPVQSPRCEGGRSVWLV
jgi:hypothetical protein